jgi:hypothetical protein
LLQDTGRAPKQVAIDLGYRGVDSDNPGMPIIHRRKYKPLTAHDKKSLKRRQAIEPLIGRALIWDWRADGPAHQPEATEIKRQAVWHRRTEHRWIPDRGGCMNSAGPASCRTSELLRATSRLRELGLRPSVLVIVRRLCPCCRRALASRVLQAAVVDI